MVPTTGQYYYQIQHVPERVYAQPASAPGLFQELTDVDAAEVSKNICKSFQKPYFCIPCHSSCSDYIQLIPHERFCHKKVVFYKI